MCRRTRNYTSDEGNIINRIQVAVALSRGWTPYWHNGKEWVAYDANNMPGDVNGDGNVNVGDIMAIINIMAKQ
jgi:hypothetical protein